MRRRKDNQKMKAAMVWFIAIVMISSTFAVIFYGFKEQGNAITYNKLKFSREGDLWVVNINQKPVFFDYLPVEVIDIELNPEIINSIRNTIEVDITYDTNATFSDTMTGISDTMTMLFNDVFNIYLRQGLTLENELNYPTITCSDSTIAVPVLYFKESNETKMYMQDSCIIAEVQNEISILKVKDRLLYGMLEVIE